MKTIILISFLFTSTAFSQESKARQYGNNGQVHVADPFANNVGNRRGTRHDNNRKLVEAKLAELLGDEYNPSHSKADSTK